ncbi:hypothetical protein ON010_g13473 [Phytophthora cinnamomi]|nr:hypothetical protein ON010_g13473 [Phytophthora cinnamomi]
MGSGEVCAGQGAGQIVRQEDPGQRELAQVHCGRLSLQQEGVAGVYGGPGLLPRRDGTVRRGSLETVLRAGPLCNRDIGRSHVVQQRVECAGRRHHQILLAPRRITRGPDTD